MLRLETLPCDSVVYPQGSLTLAYLYSQSNVVSLFKKPPQQSLTHFCISSMLVGRAARFIARVACPILALLVTVVA